ncbi:MAG TPA: glycosyltransferase family 39 protein [Candidatus Limnocylindria bacterium]|nr:glycosyltransferase family 39 protein [Candidatus Limnocylindria bacterium]
MSDREGAPGRTASPGFSRWLLPAFVAFVLLAFLGTRGLNEPDEGRYGELGREMLFGHDWLVPHLNGIGHFQKPPLIYWLTALTLYLCGNNEWGVRLPSALAAAGTIWCTFLIGRTLFSRAVAVTAALVLVSGFEFFALARTLTPDMPMTFWITAAILCFVRATQAQGEGAGGRPWNWLFFVAMGGGFFTKGPMGFVVPLAAAFAWQRSARGTPQRARLPWVPGLIVALALGLSWFVVLSLQNPELRSYFVGDELVKRFASKAHGRSKPPWFFLPVLLGGWLPWTCFLPAVLVTAWRRWRQPERLPAWQALLLGWTVIPFVILSLSGSKLLTYILPLFPALALGLAAWLHAHAASKPALLGRRLAFWCLFLPPVALGVLQRVRPDLGLSLWVPAVLIGLLFALAVAIRRASAAEPGQAFNRLAIGAALLWVALSTQVDALNPLLSRQASVRELAQTARDFSGPDGGYFVYEARACGFDFYIQSFFYKDRLIGISRGEADIVLKPTPEQELRLLDSPADCVRLAPPGKPVCGLILRQELGTTFATNEWQELGQAGQFVLIGRVNP